MNRKKEIIAKTVFIIPLILYLILLIRLLFLKNGADFSDTEFRIIPFSTVREYLQNEKSFKLLAINYLGNILLFFPLGIFLPVFFKKINISEIVLVAFFTSLYAEFLQFELEAGYADIDDLICNTLGACIGGIIYFKLRQKSRGVAHYIISFLIIAVFGTVGAVSLWQYRPDMVGVLVYNDMIAGKKLDSFDVSVECYKMSHGEIFVNPRSAKDMNFNAILNAESSYRLSDTAVFAVSYDNGAKKDYKRCSLDEIIEVVAENSPSNVHIWLDKNQRCCIVIVEMKDKNN